ncbi:MAG: deoxyribonuclease IV [Firmicutes bacterium]|nr:deoxyribonuclease IV [Bacillota bacterium]
MELIIGSHVSFKHKDQLVGSVAEALSYGANTFMFYTGAPQNTNRAEINEDLTKEAFSLMQKNNINPLNVIVHAPYIINLANNGINFDFAIKFLKEEIRRVEKLGMKYLVLHPGSHVGLGVDAGIKNIIEALNFVLTEDTNVVICLETMAGKGSEIGSTFNELKRIIDGVKFNDKLMVCMDTCHMHDAGYNVEDFDSLLEDFDKIIGIDKIACIHINDSKNVIGAHKDRHDNFGIGKIGFDNLIKIIYNERLDGVPKILETPYIGEVDDSKERLYPPYKFEIEMIRNKKFDPEVLKNIRKYYK